MMNERIATAAAGLAVLFLLGVPAGSAMEFPGASWREAAPESQGMDPAKLREALGALEEAAGRGGIGETVIVRNGVMVWRGGEADKVHGVWSMTKSFTSTCLGLLAGEGRCDPDGKAHEYLPRLRERYPDVTLKHFATMTSGYAAEGDEPRGGYTHGPSATPFNPAEPLFQPPGPRYAYWDSAMNCFALVLTKIAGEPLQSYFKRKIADPIHMNPEGWKWGGFGEIDGLFVNGGAGNHGNHIQINALEAARFGHLFLNRGVWDGETLIGGDWVEAASTAQVPAETPLGSPERSPIEGPGVYGLNWWTNGVKADGARKWPGAPADAFSASGYNNNDLFVIPSLNLVAVRLGLDQNDDPITDGEYGRFLRLLGGAVTDR